MKNIEVQLSLDHLERIANASKPIDSIAELIWNGLDADANYVEVKITHDALDAIDSIEVVDDGIGISFEDASQAFKSLGGSLKRVKRKTHTGRMIHGRQGKGRFQAFGIGDHVTWLVRHKIEPEIIEYLIKGDRSNLKKFEFGEPVITSKAPGTTVKISAIGRTPYTLKSGKATQKLTEEFALYLRQYPNVNIKYNGNVLRASDIEQSCEEILIESIAISGERCVTVKLIIIEWSISSERAMYFCDNDGFTLQRTTVGIQAPGFNFTAYLSCDLFRELDIKGELQIEEIHPDLSPILSCAREKMREYFRSRAASQVSELVETWKSDFIYPYDGLAESPIEEAERQIFDVVALNVHEYLPDFQSSSKANKKFQFRLLKNAIETSPNAVQSIIKDVLLLPSEKQEELAEILEKTSLEAMINAAKIIADRLDFLQGLEILVFDPESKKKTLERKHLHKIIAEHTWIFGEEYNLTASDKSLTNVLKRHLDLQDLSLLDDQPVVREDGSQGIVDLMLSRTVPQPRADENHHLIIELKRPNVKIGLPEASQIKEYALAIIKDDRFRDTKTSWDFWAISNEVSEAVEMEARQSNRPEGLLVQYEKPNIKIWVRTWGQVINSCRARLRFFQERLNYVSTDESGLQYLRKVHEKYLPVHLKEVNED